MFRCCQDKITLTFPPNESICLSTSGHDNKWETVQLVAVFTWTERRSWSLKILHGSRLYCSCFKIIILIFTKCVSNLHPTNVTLFHVFCILYVFQVSYTFLLLFMLYTIACICNCTGIVYQVNARKLISSNLLWVTFWTNRCLFICLFWYEVSGENKIHLKTSALVQFSGYRSTD